MVIHHLANHSILGLQLDRLIAYCDGFGDCSNFKCNVYAGLLVSFMVVVTQLALKDAEGGETPAGAPSMLIPNLAS